MDPFEQNISVLKARFPHLAERVMQPGLSERVAVVQAQDGLVAYASGGQSLTNRVNPTEQLNAELGRWHQLSNDFSRPILVLGLNPGAEVLHVFQQREQATGNECEQPLWICIDSAETLCGFLKAYDARALLASERVQLFWHETVNEQVQWLNDHPEFPYIFSMISLAPPETQMKIFPPFLQVAKERDERMAELQEMNQAYYDALDDETLAWVLSGTAGRKPRLLVPSCPWSTVIQYSIRDTCRAFEKAGWETEILDSPAIIPSHYVMESIQRFKPDLFLYVDHLRTEAPGVLPDNLMVITWVQDPMPAINSTESAQRWNEQAAPRKRDLLTGYVEQLRKFGYREDRLVDQSMMVDVECFRPRELTDAQRNAYTCSVCFASNIGLPTERIVKERLVVPAAVFACNEELLMTIHDALWQQYRSGCTLTNYVALHNFLKTIPGCSSLLHRLVVDQQDAFIEFIFWRLNDVIYRHLVLEWIDEYARTHPTFTLHLYGNDWEQHPRFSAYARGPLEHGEELAAAYQSAGWCLHLNAVEGRHQRLLEVASTGCGLLSRKSESLGDEVSIETLRSAAENLFLGTPISEDIHLSDWVVGAVFAALPDGVAWTEQQFNDAMTKALYDALIARTDWLFTADQQVRFGDRAELYNALDRTPVACEERMSFSSELIDAFSGQSLVNAWINAAGKMMESRVNLAAGVVSSNEIRLTLKLLIMIRQNECGADVLEAYQKLRAPGARLKLALVQYLMGPGNLPEAAGAVLHDLDSMVIPPSLKAEVTFWLARMDSAVDQSDLCEQTLRVVGNQYSEDASRLNVAAQLALNHFTSNGRFDHACTLPFFDFDYTQGRLSGTYKLYYAALLGACRARDDFAAQLIDEAYEDNPTRRSEYARYGWQRYALFEYRPERALEWFEQDRARGRLDAQLLEQQAHLQAMSGDLAGADETLSRAYAEHPCMSSMRSTLAWHYCRKDRMDQMELLLNWFEDDLARGNFAPVHQLVKPLGLMLLGEESKALEWVKHLYAASAEVMSGFVSLGVCSYRMDGDADHALKLMQLEDSDRLYASTELVMDAFKYRFAGGAVPTVTLSKWNAAEAWMFHLGCAGGEIEEMLGSIHPVKNKITGAVHENR